MDKFVCPFELLVVVNYFTKATTLPGTGGSLLVLTGKDEDNNYRIDHCYQRLMLEC